MTDKPTLKLDWCSYEAAKYAVEHWHYSRCMPRFKLVKIGIWENGIFIGSVIFGNGAGPQLWQAYCSNNLEVCELTRVALNKHSNPVSRIVRLAIKMLKRTNPGLRLIVSYADPEQGHVGSIYQAMNWVYIGETKPAEHFESEQGERIHSKTLKSGRPGLATKLKEQGVIKSVHTWKYKYLFPLDDAMRKQIEPLRKPYPKRGTGETDNAGQSNDQIGGASPTVPLLDPTTQTPELIG